MKTTELDNIDKWDTDCWKCGEETSVVWPSTSHLDNPIGEILSRCTDTNVERVFSKMLDREVWGNVCEHCGIYQGNHYLKREHEEQNPPKAECPVCGEMHEWYLDQGLGGAFGQGWLDCPEYGSVPHGRPSQEG